MKIGIIHTQNEVIKALKSAFLKLRQYHIAWLSFDAQDALVKIQDKPVDIVITELDGAAAFIETTKIPTLLMTDQKFSDNGKLFEAMQKGAVDICTINYEELMQTEELPQSLINKIEHFVLLTTPQEGGLSRTMPLSTSAVIPPLVIIGSSTGGPGALSTLLRTFPTDTPVAVIVVQHVDDTFIQGFAEWLDRNSTIPVEVAKDGMKPVAGKVLVSEASNHLVMTPSRKLEYQVEPADSSYFPCIDIFFQSVAEHWPTPSTAILLTGMGDDGAAGLKQLAEAGWHTIAQEEDSCVVYGMPKAAVELDAAKQILPLEEIGVAVANKIRNQEKENARSH